MSGPPYPPVRLSDRVFTAAIRTLPLRGSGTPLFHQPGVFSSHLFEFLALTIQGLSLGRQFFNPGREFFASFRGGSGLNRILGNHIIPVIGSEYRSRKPLAVDQIGPFRIRSPSITHRYRSFHILARNNDGVRAFDPCIRPMPDLVFPRDFKTLQFSATSNPESAADLVKEYAGFFLPEI